MADMMQLVGENRAIVKFGLLMMAINKRPGIAALAQLSNTDIATIDAMSCGFRIIPFLNAAGRLADPEIAFQLLASRDIETAQIYAQKLNEINATRKDLTAEAFEAISAGIDDSHSVIFEASDRWPRGIAGLIANRLTEAFARPSLVIEMTEEFGVGSARSTDGINITKILERASKHLVVFGGHKEAAGFTVRKESLEAFRTDVVRYIEEEKLSSVLEKEIMADTECYFSEISINVLDFLKKLEPFGEGNEEPIFLTKNVSLTELRMVGSKQNHAKFTFMDAAKVTMRGIAFSRPEFSKLSLGKKYDILYSIRENIWNGRRLVDLHIIDIKESKNGV
jgi:single-stranded-DNA-specific exonuclease